MDALEELKRILDLPLRELTFRGMLKDLAEKLPPKPKADLQAILADGTKNLRAELQKILQRFGKPPMKKKKAPPKVRITPPIENIKERSYLDRLMGKNK